jgi:hypothetical protein
MAGCDIHIREQTASSIGVDFFDKPFDGHAGIHNMMDHR